VSSPNGTQAIDRAATLLAQVVHGSEPASFTELTAACGLAKSTTSRLLMALERHQLVRRDGDGRFWPGELFVRYAWRGTADADLVAVAQPFLAQLGEQTSETINLGIAISPGGSGTSRAGRDNASGPANAGVAARAGGGGAGSDTGGYLSGARVAHDMLVQQIAQVDSRYMIGGTNWVGLAVPLHCSALGKVLLAFGAARMPSEPFEARTVRTITSRAALDAELMTVRERGYAVMDEELEPGLVAVAAPVFAGGVSAIAALSVSAPAARLTANLIPPTAGKCVQVAQALSATLGGNRISQHVGRDDTSTAA
jgi:IclR family transcriptional regulator, acetate operon repressor